jgi:hypothetical protein
VVKGWDLVCPVCGTTLVDLAEPKDSIKVKGNLPGWEDFKQEEARPRKEAPQENEYDPKLVRAAIKSDYDKGRRPSKKALEALGQVSLFDGSGPKKAPARRAGDDDVEEIDAVEAVGEDDDIEPLDTADLDQEEGTDRLRPQDIQPLDEEPSRPGQIVVEGKKRTLVYDFQETSVTPTPSSLPSFPPPRPTGAQPETDSPPEDALKSPATPPKLALPPAGPLIVPPLQMGSTPIVRPPQPAPAPAGPAPVAAGPMPSPTPGMIPIQQPMAPTPQAAVAAPQTVAPAQQPVVQPQAAPLARQPTQPPRPAASAVAGLPFQDTSPSVRLPVEQPRRAPKTTAPVEVVRQDKLRSTVPVQREEPTAPAPPPRPDLAGRPSPRPSTPADVPQYDPETLRRIMQQAQAAAMRRRGMPGEEQTRISLPLAILLIVMGTLSILGLAVIIFLLVHM